MGMTYQRGAVWWVRVLPERPFHPRIEPQHQRIRRGSAAEDPRG